MRQPIQVLIYVYRESDRGREYLMLRRTPAGGGFWQGVSGGVEDDEDLLTTACREVREETGFTAEIHSIGYSYTIPSFHDRKLGSLLAGSTIPVNVFVAQVDSDAEPVIDPQEHDLYLWCPIFQADRLLYWPSDREALRQVEAWLRLR